jgi:hypothetical protein
MTDRLEEFLRSQLRHQTESIAAGRDVWSKAIDRGRRLRRRRRGSTWLGVGVVVAVVIVTGSLAGGPGDEEPQPIGPTAETPSASLDAKRDGCPVGEEGRVLRVSRKSLVLGCARLPDGRRLVLLDGFEGHGLCLQLVGIDNRARQCGYAPSALDPPNTRTITFQGMAQKNKSARLEVYGITAAEVAAVELTFPRGDSSHRVRAALIRVTDDEILAQARIAEPFGYFAAELPAGTSSVSATALGEGGRRIATDEFEPYPWSKWSRTMITGVVVWDGSP